MFIFLILLIACTTLVIVNTVVEPPTNTQAPTPSYSSSSPTSSPSHSSSSPTLSPTTFPQSVRDFTIEAGPLLPIDFNDDYGVIYFGITVDLSYDGSFGVIGGPGDDYRTGALWVLENNEVVAKLNGTNVQQPFRRLGRTNCKISDDGTYIVAGSPSYDDYVGGIFVFTAPDYSYEILTLPAPLASNMNNIGGNMDINGSANVIVTNGFDINVFLQVICVFRNGEFIQIIYPPEMASSQWFGAQISVSSSGEWFLTLGKAIVGNIPAHFYKFNGTQYELVQTVSNATRVSGLPGCTLSKDGTRALFYTSADAGEIWVYDKGGDDTWNFQGHVTDETYNVGKYVAISANGQLISACDLKWTGCGLYQYNSGTSEWVKTDNITENLNLTENSRAYNPAFSKESNSILIGDWDDTINGRAWLLTS